jgi:predicted site-specific integrase-resolvase
MSVYNRKGYRTTGQAATILGVSRSVIDNWCASDSLDYVVTPAGWRLIPDAEVERQRKVLAARTKGRTVA